MASTAEYTCGYCLTEKDAMTDARKLPCGHFFCLNCLLRDIQNSTRLKCITCRQEHKDLDLMMLESCLIEKETILCNVCEKNSPAKIFCITCDKNMCNEHAEMHESFNKQLGLSHVTRASHLPSEVASEKCKRLCGIHDEEFKGVCIACQCLLCFECLAETKCPNSSSLQHTAKDVGKLSESYKKNLNEKLSKLWDRINDIENLDKKANCLLAEEQTKCEKMKQLVDEVLQEQNAVMAENARTIKLTIDSHYNGCENQAALYTKTLCSNKEGAEYLCKEIHDLKQKSGYDIFLNGAQLVEKSETFLTAEMHIFKLAVQEIYRFEQKEQIEKELEAPSQLKLQLKEKEAKMEVSKLRIEQIESQLADLHQRYNDAATKNERETEALSKKYEECSAQLKEKEAKMEVSKLRIEQIESQLTDLRQSCNDAATKTDNEKAGSIERYMEAATELKMLDAAMEKYGTRIIELEKTKEDAVKRYQESGKTGSVTTVTAKGEGKSEADIQIKEADAQLEECREKISELTEEVLKLIKFLMKQEKAMLGRSSAFIVKYGKKVTSMIKKEHGINDRMCFPL